MTLFNSLSKSAGRESMRKSFLFVFFMILCGLEAGLFPCFAVAQSSKAQFKIGAFTVFVNTEAVAVGGKSLAPQPWPQPEKTAAYAGKKFSGTGRILIRNFSVDVRFRDIVLDADPATKTIVATAGIVSGIQSPGSAAVAYELDGFSIEINRGSIRLTPTSATAAVKTTFELGSFTSSMGMMPGVSTELPNMASASPGISGNPQATGSTSMQDLVSRTKLTISSESSRIAPDGSIAGDNFHGAGSFYLRNSVYRVEIVQNDQQAVRIGPSFTTSDSTHSSSQASLAGIAFSGQDAIFTVQISVRPREQRANLSLELANAPLTRKPEPGYVLTLKTGTVTYVYGPSGLEQCEGFISADLAVPPAVPDEHNGQIQLHDIILKTDKTGALFNNLSIPQKLKIGYDATISGSEAHPIYFIDAQDTDSAWVYFPEWQSSKSHSSFPAKNDCLTQFQFLDPHTAGAERYNVHARPGITIAHGVIYYESPQVIADKAQPLNIHKLMVPFKGGLTLTSWGIYGELTSGGNSFIPFNENRDTSKSAEPVPSAHYTWEEIIRENPRLYAKEPTPRFSLAGLQVLEMRIDKTLVCQNRLSENKFRYLVHFPYPSFIDLDFEDSSLDAHGLLHQALGPVASRSQGLVGDTNSTTASGTPSGKGPALSPNSQPNPDTQILMFWRLPISFADRGVNIAYATPTANADVTVTMDETRQNDQQEILGSEIWLKPLYSKKSATKSGVRIKATLDTKGMFTLKAWDQSPVFAKIYPKPGTERAVGYEVQLSGVSLADAASDPYTRKVDHNWMGNIMFPFFGWQAASFQVRNLIPGMVAPTAMVGEQPYFSCTDQSVENGSDPNKKLHVEVHDLQYVTGSTEFTSANATYNDILDQVPQPTKKGSLDMTSFTNAIIKASNAPPVIPVMSIGDENPNPDLAWTPQPSACGATSPKAVRQIMTEVMDSNSITDLVCYDVDARNARNIPGACCKEYFLGTYRFQTRKGPNDTAKDILVIPNVKYYPFINPLKLEVNGSEMSFQSDEVDSPSRFAINIPGAQLTFEDHTTIIGDFGATMTNVAQSLPYEGDLRFALDTQCGYFYLQGAGSFTYFLRFSGQTFIVHAPYRFLNEDHNIPWVTKILHELSLRALFDEGDDQEFRKWTHLDTLESTPDTVITGLFTSGNASFSKSIGIAELDLAAGPGLYAFQFKNASGTTYNIGTFVHERAKADVGYDGATIGVESNDIYGGEYTSGTDEVKIQGTLHIKGCASLILAHCEGCLRVGASLSNKSGFDFSDPRLGGSCDTGGCGDVSCGE